MFFMFADMQCDNESSRRKRKIISNQENLYNDDSSEFSDESVTSGSSFHPSDSDEDTASSRENLLCANSKDPSELTVKSKVLEQVKKKPRVAINSLDKVAGESNSRGIIISKEDICTPNCDLAKKPKNSKKGESKGKKRKSPLKKKADKQAPMKSGHNYDRDKIVEACDRTRKGETPAAVARSLGARKRKYVLNNKTLPTGIGEIKTTHDGNTRNEVLKRLKKGESTISIAKDLDIDERTVKTWQTRYLVGENSKLKVSNENYSRETIIQVCKRLKEGATVTALAMELGAGVCTVARWRDTYLLKGEPVPMDGYIYKRHYGNDEKIEALNRLKQGESIESVALDLHVRVDTMKTWKKKYLENEESDLRMAIGQNYSKEFKSNVCHRLIRGESAKVLAEKLCLKLTTIEAWQKKYIVNGKVVMKTQRLFDKAKLMAACNRLLQGESAKTIALDCNVFPTTVQEWGSRYIVDGKVSVESKTFFNKDLIFDTLRRYREGVSSTILAKEIGANPATIACWNRNYGHLDPNVTKSKDMPDQSKTIEAFNREKPGKCEQISKRVTKTYDKKKILAVCNRLLQGETIADAAREFRVSFQTIFSWRKRYIRGGRVLVENIRFFDKNDRCRALKRLNQGLSMSAVAKEIGVEVATILRWRRKDGGKKLKSSKEMVNLQGHKIIEACNRLKRGDSVRKVALDLEVDITSVQKWRREYLQISEIKGGKKYDEKIIVKACERIKSGIPLVTLEKELGVERSTLCKWKSEHLINKKFVSRNGSLYDKRTIFEACNRLNRGDSPEAVSNHFGVDVRDVLDWQREYCLKEDERKATIIRNIKSKDKQSTSGSLSRVFVPLRKVYMPRKVKLRVVRMCERGVSVGQLSKKLNINGLTINSWIFNKDLLMRKI